MIAALAATAAAATPPGDPWGASFDLAAKVVLALYLLALLAIGYRGFRRGRNNEVDYYLAGRGQGWFVTSLTIMATFFSSFALLSAPGLVYKEGVAFTLFALNVPFTGLCVYLLGGRIRRLGARRGYVTPADLVADYYGGAGDGGGRAAEALRLLVALVGIGYAVPYIVMQIQAGGIVTEVLFPGLKNGFVIGAVGLALVTMVYIMVGGMRSVAWTDALQGLLLGGGMLLAGVAVVAALGGVGGFFQKVGELPATSLSLPGNSGAFPAFKMFTICLFASVGSIIQPAQWMRFYAADSNDTLRRSALLFATVLPVCFLFGVMLVGLGGQALYPLVDPETGELLRDGAGNLVPHPEVGATLKDFDKILVVVLKEHLPALLGGTGVVLASLTIVAIMAASMSTADSNLHALSAVLTRDGYERYLRPAAGEAEKVWFGRAMIAGTTAVALGLIMVSSGSEHFNPIALIAQMAFVAIGFSTQLLPVTLDILFIRRGTAAGAVAGTATGLVLMLLFTPLLSLATGAESGAVELMGKINQTVDKGAFALVGNVVVFVAVSAFTRRPEAERREAFARDLAPGRGRPGV